MKKLTCTVMAVLLSSFTSNLYAATYSGGAGTEANPYQIANLTNLLQLAGTTSDYSKCFILTADIDMSGMTFTNALIAPDTNSSDEVFSGTVFTGIFNGNNHTISGLTISCADAIGLGLFGAIYGGQVFNLRLTNVNIGGYEAFEVGGLVGELNTGTISRCSCSGQINGAECVGGLVGSNTSATITACYTTGTVTGNGSWMYDMGGLVGWNVGTINNCYSTCAVTSGDNSWQMGGLVGGNYYGTVSYCFSTGSVTYGENSLENGGLIGDNSSGQVLFCFWDMTTSGQSTSAGGTGLITYIMKTASLFTTSGWDFVDETSNGTADIWRLCTDGTSYPKLAWQSVSTGDFTCPDGVDIDDLMLLSEDWINTYSAALSGADATCDKKVNMADFVILAQYWLE